MQNCKAIKRTGCLWKSEFLRRNHACLPEHSILIILDFDVGKNWIWKSRLCRDEYEIKLVKKIKLLKSNAILRLSISSFS